MPMLMPMPVPVPVLVPVYRHCAVRVAPAAVRRIPTRGASAITTQALPRGIPPRRRN
jgi:hypothetical protein